MAWLLEEFQHSMYLGRAFELCLGSGKRTWKGPCR